MAPWFNYFQMTKQLEECDKLLKEKAKRLIKYKELEFQELWHSTKCKSQSQLKQRKETFDKIIELLQLSNIYNLNDTRLYITYHFIEQSMYTNLNNNFLEMHDLYDIQAITAVVELALPLEKEDIHYEDYETYEAVFFFDDLFECRDELQKFSLEELNNNKNMLAWIISSHMERRAKKLLKEEYESLRNDKDYLAAQNKCLKGKPRNFINSRYTWLGCSTCGKWRMLPPDISAEEVEALPDVWTCADNIWDPARSNCNAEECTARWMLEYYEHHPRRQEEEDDSEEDD